MSARWPGRYKDACASRMKYRAALIPSVRSHPTMVQYFILTGLIKA